MTAPRTTTGAASLRALFDSPPRDFSPTPLWWWSGEKITRARLRDQLSRLAEGGVYNVVVINLAPSGPLFGAVVDDPVWFSDEWFERFGDLCDEARQLGMRVWFYDQIGFSGANIQGRLTQREPWAAGRALVEQWVDLDEGREVDAALLDPARVVAVFAEPDGIHPHGRRLEVRDHRVAGDGAERVRIISWRPTAFDYLSVDAVALLLDHVHGEFDRRLGDRLGNVIAGSFQDELPATNSWTPGFAESFAEHYGYDLLDELPALFSPVGERGAAVLHDYFEHRATLTERALFEPLGRWHDERGLLLGSDQLNPARAGWPTQATQLYTDYFRTHRHFSAAGSDHEGDSKVHSSLAHLYGHDRVWLESFHSSGWGGTLQDTYDWLLPFLRSGANLYNPHAVYYSMIGGWFEWAPPSTDWRQPYWGQYRVFADCVARIASLMSWGAHACSVAVLYPSATSKSALPLTSPVDHFSTGQIGAPFEAADTAQRVFLELAGSNNWWRTNPGALNAAAVDFDVVDDSSLQSAAIGGGAAAVRDERYRVVLVPGLRWMEDGTARALADLLDAGGRVVVVGDDPAAPAGSQRDRAQLDRLLAHPLIERAVDASAAADSVRSARVLGAELASLVRTDGEGTSIAFIPAAQPNASGYPLRTGDEWFWDDFDFDPARYRQHLDVRLPEGAAWAQAWNPATGERIRLELDAGAVTLPFAGAPALLLVWGDSAADEPDGASAAPRLVDDAEGGAPGFDEGWTAELIPTLDNTDGDLDRPAHPGPVPHRIWSIETTDDDGDGPWRRTRATFGVHGEVATPVADAESAEFAPWSYSDSRGIEKDPVHKGMLGVKGRVPDAFVVTDCPPAGTVARYRTIVRLPEPGRFELIVGATAPKRVLLDGVVVADDTDDPHGGFLLRTTVDLADAVTTLEYELGETSGRGTFMSPSRPDVQGSFFAFARPGAFPEHPEFIRAARTEGRVEAGEVVFSRDVDVPEGLDRARIVVGSTAALSIEVDGELVGRQERAEYYESDWGAAPQFFVHDLTARLGAGRHAVDIRCETDDPTALVVVDLVLEGADGPTAIVSDPAWSVDLGDGPQPAVRSRAGWGELANTHLARRPHPLARAQWLGGAPEIGTDTIAVETTHSLEARPQRIRTTLPAGTSLVTVPTPLDATVRIGGREVPTERVDAGLLARLDEPAATAVELEVVTEPTAFRRGGAALDGAIEPVVERAPVRFAPWSELGLGWFSGGVRYAKRLDLAEPTASALLDLGTVRGHVNVRVNGGLVGQLFCTPWRIELGSALVAGANLIEVEVFNTLGPYLDESGPTWAVFPSQRIDGILGPVRLLLADPATATALPAELGEGVAR